MKHIKINVVIIPICIILISAIIGHFYTFHSFKFIIKSPQHLDLNADIIKTICIMDSYEYHLTDKEKINMLISEINSIDLVQFDSKTEKVKGNNNTVSIMFKDEKDNTLVWLFIGDRTLIETDKNSPEYTIGEYVIQGQYYLENPKNILDKYYMIADDFIDRP